MARIMEIPSQNLVNAAPNYLPDIEVTTIPSGGKVYPENYSIKYRPYTYGELIKLSNSKINRVELLKLAMHGVFCENMTVFDLTYFDAQYIVLLRKLSSLGHSTFTVTVGCPKCNKPTSFDMELSSLQFDELEVDFPITVNMTNGKSLEFEPLNVKDFVELCNTGRDTDELAILATEVKNMSYEEAYSLISNSTGEDYLALQMLDKYLYHGVKEVITVCNNLVSGDRCGAQIRVDIDGEDTVLFPFRGDIESAKNRIQFGKVEQGK